MELRFSIRYKILGVVTTLLVIAIGMYLLLATRIFRQDKSELVYDLNRSVVTTLSTEFETTLRGSADKLKLFALIFAGQQEFKGKEAFKEIISHDPLLVRLELFEMGSSKKMNLVSEVYDEAFTKLYGTNEDFYKITLPAARPVPFAKIQGQSLYVWNATIANGPALLGMGLSVVKESSRGVPEKMMAVVGYLKSDLFLKNLRSSQLTQAFIVGSDGRVLVHSNSQYMIDEKDFSTSPIVKELKNNKFPSGVMAYKEGAKDELGAYAHVGFGGIGVVSQVDSEKAFFAVKSLVTRSVLFALIIVTATFIATVFFSRTLTRPLQKLLSAMEKVAQGNLETELKIKSGDEISVLAKSFNQMTKDLKVSRASLEEINRDLESKVLDRTRKLEDQNRAVQEAQEALLKTTRLASVGEIAGRTAHEVLNPLTSLMARVNKIQKRLGDEIIEHKDVMQTIISAWSKEYKEKGSEKFFKSLTEPSTIDPRMSLLQEDLNNIGTVLTHWDEDLSTLSSDTQFLMQQAGRIEKILGQMRSLSVVSSSKSKLQAKPVIHEAVNILGDLFAKNNVVLEEAHDASYDNIHVDRDELIQVLTNLLRNALQAVCENKETQNRKVTIKAHTGQTNSGQNKKLYIDISDTGVGISDDNKKLLFKNQFTTKSKENGTGLGLSISRRFIRNFNGDLYLLQSEPGRQTVFRIELPLIEADRAKGAA